MVDTTLAKQFICVHCGELTEQCRCDVADVSGQATITLRGLNDRVKSLEFILQQQQATIEQMLETAHDLAVYVDEVAGRIVRLEKVLASPPKSGGS